MNINTSEIKTLPIYEHLEEICSSLKKSESRFLVLTAETAAGKSTALPIALLEHFDKKVLMLEPRRIATLSIANRLSSLINEKCGQTIGYRMYLEKSISDKTRLEVITEAILTKKLQTDPSLENVSVVVLDEFHERSIHTDLALAFLKEAMQLRDDLYVLIMSATIDTDKLSAFLGIKDKPCTVINIKGRQHPIEIEYSNSSITSEIDRNLHNISNGQTILVFLPGIKEIRSVQNQLNELNIIDENTELHVLHSSINFDEQKAVLSQVAENKKRIVLSSSIAETSITVPGVYVVIDSGLTRTNRMNIAVGMETLNTEIESEFSAEQRTGRAGRLGKGKCIRLWNLSEPRTRQAQPEILRTDITSLVLECFAWGISNPEKLEWLDSPNITAWNSSKILLEKLGCIENDKITPKGKLVLKLPLHPRLACVALTGNLQTVLKYSQYSNSSEYIQNRFLNSIKSKIENNEIEKSAFISLLHGYPDRIGMLTQNGLYQFPSGRIAKLPSDFVKNTTVFPKWIIAPEVNAGQREGFVYKFEIPENEKEIEKLERWIFNNSETKIDIHFENGKISKHEITCYEKIIISEKKLNSSPEDYAKALCNEVSTKGIEVLPLSTKSKNLLIRYEFYNQQNNISENIYNLLKTSTEEWLLPFMSGKTSIDEKTVYDSLSYRLNGDLLNREVPETIILENGKKRKISYEKQTLSSEPGKLIIRPVIEIIIQQIFGCFSTPKVLGVPVLLKLLSPASRPLQITDDLDNFWKTTWPEICKEMKGKYPKHNWNYKISED